MRKFWSQMPLRQRLITVFLPLLTLSVSLTGFVSYALVRQQLRQNAEALLGGTVDQSATFINDKFETAFEQLVIAEHALEDHATLFETPGTVDDFYDKINFNKELNDIYNRYSTLIDSMYVGLSSGREFFVQKEYIPRAAGVDLNDWLQTYPAVGKGYHWIGQHQDVVFQTVEQRQVFSVIKSFGGVQAKVRGVLILNIRAEVIQKILDNVRVSDHGTVILTGADGRVMNPLKNTALPAEEIAGKLRNREESRGAWHLEDGGGVNVIWAGIRINGWRFAALAPDKDFTRGADSIWWSTLMLVVGLSLVVAVLAALIAGSMTKPLRQLARQARQVEKGDLGVVFVSRDSNEVGVLAQGLNRLLASVNNLLREVRQEQERKRHFEIAALQAQIKPHFLYNTLGSIRQLVGMKDTERAETMLGALIRFLMIGLSRGQELIPVDEEAEHVRSYLVIQKMRYSRDFDYDICLPEMKTHWKVPKLTLQPLVENAIYHGVKSMPGRGEILLEAGEDDAGLWLRVRDNGPGMAPEELEHVRTRLESETPPDSGYGLWNVRQRLRLTYGTQALLRLDQTAGGFAVTVHIPWQEEGGKP